MHSVLVIETATPIVIGIMTDGIEGWSGFAFVDTKPVPIGQHVRQQAAIDRIAYLARNTSGRMKSCFSLWIPTFRYRRRPRQIKKIRVELPQFSSNIEDIVGKNRQDAFDLYSQYLTNISNLVI